MSTPLMPLADATATIDYAATTFVILCASLVLLMTVPALALFYGGMTRSKSVLNMMMMSFGAAGLVGVLYVLYGYSMSFGTENIAGIIANPFEKFGLAGTDGLVNPFGYEGYGNIPELALVAFQLTFAVITVALISGAIADRVKFSTWMVFAGLWVTLAYFPMAHMVWGGGLLSGSRVRPVGRDLRVDRRQGGRRADRLRWWHRRPHQRRYGRPGPRPGGRTSASASARSRCDPHNVPLTMIGAGLLWFGWFGFNAGSELAADGTAALVWVNTTVATVRRDARLAPGGEAAGRARHLDRRRLRRRRRVWSPSPRLWCPLPIGSIILGLVAGVLCRVWPWG
jgi:Amt family ammonium transporter